MFAFDQWGDWAEAHAVAMRRQGVEVVFKDGRKTPELAANPSFVVEASTSNRLGYIGFWKNGLCDIHVIDTTNDTLVENASMLEATDETVPHLFSRFGAAL